MNYSIRVRTRVLTNKRQTRTRVFVHALLIAFRTTDRKSLMTRLRLILIRHELLLVYSSTCTYSARTRVPRRNERRSPLRRPRAACRRPLGRPHFLPLHLTGYTCFNIFFPNGAAGGVYNTH